MPLLLDLKFISLYSRAKLLILRSIVELDEYQWLGFDNTVTCAPSTLFKAKSIHYLQRLTLDSKSWSIDLLASKSLAISSIPAT